MLKWKSRRWEAFNATRKQAHEGKKSAASPSTSLSLHLFIWRSSFSFLSSCFSLMRLLIPPPPLVLAHVYLRRSHFFFFPQSLIHSIFSPLSSSRLSGPPLLFYSRGCNGSNVEAESPGCLAPPVSSTIRVFDQFVTGAGDRASALQHCRQREH